MLKALVKKQLSELNAFYFLNPKTGKMRSKKGVISTVTLYAILFIFLGAAFYFVAAQFAQGFIPLGLSWLYFALMSLLAILMGTFGSVFNTYSGLYMAKDNETLLSMPIPPLMILESRMIGVYAMGLMYEVLVYVPTIIAYFVYGQPSMLSAINSILLMFILGVVILVISCALGFLVALISQKLKNKSLITVIISLVFFAIYYYFCMNLYEKIQSLILNATTVGVKIKAAVWPAYCFGEAAAGNVLMMILFTLGTAALFAITAYILSKSFTKIVTRKPVDNKPVYEEKRVEKKGTKSALFGREWKRFTSSATYMLNCALGTVLMPISTILIIVFREKIADFVEMINMLVDIPEGMFAIALAASTMLIVSMNDVTAPSISLEGKNIWILQSMPVDMGEILGAKKRLGEVLTLPVALLFIAVSGWALKLEVLEIVMAMVLVYVYAELLFSFGIMLNLKKPNLDWTSEVVPIKQSMGVAVSMFGGWALSLAVGVGGWFALKVVDWNMYIIVVIVIIAFAARWVNTWLSTKGAKIFNYL